MGLYDRDYTRDSFSSRFRNAPQMRMTFPRITPVVLRLMIANVIVFFAGIIFFPTNIPVQVGSQTILINFLEKWFAVFPDSPASMFQIWRLVTYQFLHGGIMHILFNMLGLFFLGPTLERHWGSKKFLIFYLSCGVAGGLFYTFLIAVNFLIAAPMVGASGAILGMLAACAILFPHFVVFILIFPIPIRIAAIALTVIYLAAVISRGENAGGDAAHLAGMAAGAIYVFSQSWQSKLKLKIKADTWQKKNNAQKNLQLELDRILEKVHNSGIHSLTARERKTLKQATKAQQTQNKF